MRKEANCGGRRSTLRPESLGICRDFKSVPKEMLRSSMPEMHETYVTMCFIHTHNCIKIMIIHGVLSMSSRVSICGSRTCRRDCAGGSGEVLAYKRTSEC